MRYVDCINYFDYGCNLTKKDKRLYSTIIVLNVWNLIYRQGSYDEEDNFINGFFTHVMHDDQ